MAGSRVGCFFLCTHGTFVFLYQSGIARTAGSCRAVYCDDDRQRTFYGFHTSVDMTFNGDTACCFIHIQDFFSVSDLCQSQLFCYLGTNLCCISVDSLTATDDDVIIINFFDSRSQSV